MILRKYIISKFTNLPKEAKRNRWCKVEKNFIIDAYPNSIKVYSEYMKGVDISNQLFSYYELNSKTSAITQKIFRLEIENLF